MSDKISNPNHNPLVSIITPSYNQARYLEKTILSVLNQDYQPIEYIIVDGGSKDGSLQIIEKYHHRLEWWVSEPDSGQAEAINKGIHKAKGEIIGWLNSDDIYLPGAVKSAVTDLEGNPGVGMVFGNAVSIDSNGIPIRKFKFDNYTYKDLTNFQIICQPAVFFRRSVLDKIGLLDTDYNYLLDHHLWLRIAENYPIKHNATGLFACARQHPEAKNTAQANKFSQEIFKLLKYVNNQGIDEKRTTAGAYRLSARYLLDGGLPKKALSHYFKALWLSPIFTLKHWHRMIYAVISILGGKRLSNWYYRMKNPKIPELEEIPGIHDWEGIDLNSGKD